MYMSGPNIQITDADNGYIVQWNSHGREGRLGSGTVVQTSGNEIYKTREEVILRVTELLAQFRVTNRDQL